MCVQRKVLWRILFKCWRQEIQCGWRHQHKAQIKIFDDQPQCVIGRILRHSIMILIEPIRPAKPNKGMQVSRADRHCFDFMPHDFRNTQRGEVSRMQVDHMSWPHFKGNTAKDLHKLGNLNLDRTDGNGDSELAVHIQRDELRSAVGILLTSWNLIASQRISVGRNCVIPVDNRMPHSPG